MTDSLSFLQNNIGLTDDLLSEKIGIIWKNLQVVEDHIDVLYNQPMHKHFYPDQRLFYIFHVADVIHF